MALAAPAVQVHNILRDMVSWNVRKNCSPSEALGCAQAVMSGTVSPVLDCNGAAEEVLGM